MKISARADYAVRAVAFLAIRNGEILQIADIAREERIPPKFLEGVLSELKRAGIVDSKRGIGGGYRLARSSEEISVGEVIRIFDGPLGPVGGIERMRSENDLTEAEYCLRNTWLKVTDAISKVVDETTFASIAALRRSNVARRPQAVTHGTAWF